jgi:hypothetical protein
MNPKIFISYSADDERKRLAFTRALKKATPSFVPVVVLDRREPGKPLTDKVMDCINEADFLVPILTSSSISNQWVNQEIGYAHGVQCRIVPIVEQEIISELKGFVHDQHDLPFSFRRNQDRRHEARDYRRAYELLIEYLQGQRSASFQSAISPSRVVSGDAYTTEVTYRGTVQNGFFDNRVVHQTSDFRKWNWDPETLPSSSSGAPGTLNGVVDITKAYSHSTRNWPIGKYKIYVRLYSHPTPGVPGRIMVAEEEHDFEVA